LLEPHRSLAPLTLSLLGCRGADGVDPQRRQEDDGCAALRDYRGQHGAESAQNHPGGVRQVGSREAWTPGWEPGTLVACLLSVFRASVVAE
jgi:hypothetical protein